MFPRGSKRPGLRRAIRHGRRGAAAVEFALVLPLLVFILGGIVDFARAFFELQSMVNAASEAARMAIVSSDTRVNSTAVEDRVKAFFPGDWPAEATVEVTFCTPSGTCGTGLGGHGDLVSVRVTRPFDQLFLGVFKLQQFGISPLPENLSYTASGRRQ